MKKMFKDGNLYILKPKTPAYGGYVTDGLIFQLDCDSVDIQNKTWTDLIGGINMVTSDEIKIEDGGVKSVNDGMDFNGSIPNGSQIEISFKAKDSDIAEFLEIFPIEGYDLVWDSFQEEVCFRGEKAFHISNDDVYDNVTTISLNKVDENLYINGEQIQGYENEYISNYYRLLTEGDMTLYSIRIYDRVLVQEEITKNAMNDRNRLNN